MRSKLVGGGADQSPVAYCPEEPGSAYVCTRSGVTWAGEVLLDAAILE